MELKSDKVATFAFVEDSVRPDGAKVGDQIELNLVNKDNGDTVTLKAVVTSYEKMRTGYMLGAKIDGDTPYILEVFVGQNPMRDGVRMYKNMQIRP